MLPDLAAMPVRVRPVPFETVDSYAKRLGDANHMPGSQWRGGLRSGLRNTTPEEEVRRETAVERLGGLRPGHFENERSRLPIHHDGTTCNKCTTGLTGRYGCTRCAADAAEQYPHDGPRTCRRHRRWVGPGTAPNEQFQVGPDVLKADREYDRLRRRGVVDAHRMAELLDFVNIWADSELPEELNPAMRFVVAVNVVKELLTESALADMRSAAGDASAQYAAVCRKISTIVGGRPSVVLADLMWLLMRTAGAAEGPRPHLFSAPRAPENVDQSEYLAQRRSCSFPRTRERHLLQFVASDAAGTRLELATKAYARSSYICSMGHHFDAVIKSISRFSSSDGCRFCGRQAPLVGFNTLADTHPEIAREWHPTKNAVEPTTILSGSSIPAKWLCAAEGHTFEATVANRTTGKTCCPFCANKRVDPEFNSIAATHPHIAAEWHPTLNGKVMPADVVIGTAKKYWWQCPKEGHQYRAAPNNRLLGTGCTVCLGKRSDPSTSLQSAHPDVADLWHPTKNGTLTPSDVQATASRKVWWRCWRGHERLASVRTIVNRPSCRECVGRTRKVKLSMAVTHPHLAEEFDSERNGDLTPEITRADTSRVLAWRCARCEHRWRAKGSTRTAGGARCRVCSNRLVVPGDNDLATTHPLLAAEFHPTRNTPLLASTVAVGSGRRLWWLCAHNHMWLCAPQMRLRGTGCPTCSGVRVVPGVNDMATTHPHVAADWIEGRNGVSTPSSVKATTSKKIWWRCAAGHEVIEAGRKRVARGGCGECVGTSE